MKVGFQLEKQLMKPKANIARCVCFVYESLGHEPSWPPTVEDRTDVLMEMLEAIANDSAGGKKKKSSSKSSNVREEKQEKMEVLFVRVCLKRMEQALEPEARGSKSTFLDAGGDAALRVSSDVYVLHVASRVLQVLGESALPPVPRLLCYLKIALPAAIRVLEEHQGKRTQRNITRPAAEWAVEALPFAVALVGSILGDEEGVRYTLLKTFSSCHYCCLLFLSVLLSILHVVISVYSSFFVLVHFVHQHQMPKKSLQKRLPTLKMGYFCRWPHAEHDLMT